MPGPARTICYDGPDYATACITDLKAFSAWSMQLMFRLKGLTWDFVERQNIALEQDDLVQEGALRILELRSDPRGENNWKFFSNVAQSHQAHYLRSQRRFAKFVRLEDLADTGPWENQELAEMQQ